MKGQSPDQPGTPAESPDLATLLAPDAGTVDTAPEGKAETPFADPTGQAVAGDAGQPDPTAILAESVASAPPPPNPPAVAIVLPTVAANVSPTVESASSEDIAAPPEGLAAGGAGARPESARSDLAALAGKADGKTGDAIGDGSAGAKKPAPTAQDQSVPATNGKAAGAAPAPAGDAAAPAVDGLYTADASRHGGGDKVARPAAEPAGIPSAVPERPALASNDPPLAQLHLASAGSRESLHAVGSSTAMSAAATSQTSAPNTATAGVPLAAVAVEIAVRAQAGSNRFEIRLDPPELGRIDVRLDVDRHGNVTSRLIAERGDTLDLLRREAPQLERALQDAGLKTGDNGLQFSLRDHSPGGGRDAREASAGKPAAEAAEPEPLPAEALRSYRWSGTAGGVDIRV